MKEILRRIFIVIWILVAVYIVIEIIDEGLFSESTWLHIVAFAIGPVLALQFIFVGIVNPIRLIKKSPELIGDKE